MGDRGGLKVDGAVSSQLANVAEAATMLERRGYDCCWTAEINHDPFLPLVLAAEHTTTIELGTSIAVAFARNPMTVANVTTKRYFEEVTMAPGSRDELGQRYGTEVDIDSIARLCQEHGLRFPSPPA
jgi:hypothetical protein